MTNFAPSRAGLARNLFIGVAVVLVALACAAPASALVTEVGGTPVGAEPRMGNTIVKEGVVELDPHSGKGAVEIEGAETFGNTNGNAVLHGTNLDPVFWDPRDTFFIHHEWMTHIDTFFQQMGEASGSLSDIFAPLGQYRDRSNQGAIYHTTYTGSYTDFKQYPAPGCTDPNPLAVGADTCLTDAQLRTELQAFVASHGLPTGMHTIYYLILPPGVTVCLDAAATHCSDYTVNNTEIEKEERKSASYTNSFCSYHGDINPTEAPEGDASTIVYGAIPWTAGTLGSDSFLPSEPFEPQRHFYQQGFDCQDGGWNPEKHEENLEKAEPPSEGEQEILKGEKGTPKEKELLEETRSLEGPHQEETNQEGKGEFGDYSPGLADLIINQIAVEHANIVTDPLLNSWQDSEHREVVDECRNTFAATAGPNGGGSIEGSPEADEHTKAGTLSNTDFAGTRYYVNNVFSISSMRCVGGTAMVPRFTAPNPVNAGEIVGFDGMESSVGLLEGLGFGPSGPPTKTYGTFTWHFGDGTEAKGFAPGSPVCEAPWLSPCAGSIFHAYAYGGTYPVTLTVTDVAGNVDSVTHSVTVAGPPPPSPAAAPGPAAGSAPAAAAKSGAGTGAGTQPGKPVASASVISRSLRTAVKKGVAVAYSVNERVTGHFEVLMARSLASRLKIGGTPATGLPAGTPAQLVIGKAVLVATKGGHSVVHVMLSKSASARLRHAHKLPLMLRLIVRNAASTPESTTVISSATLVG